MAYLKPATRVPTIRPNGELGWIEVPAVEDTPGNRAYAKQRADLERSQNRWKTADKFAYAAAATPFAAAAAPAVMGAFGGGGAATAALPSATSGIGTTAGYGTLFGSAAGTGAGAGVGAGTAAAAGSAGMSIPWWSLASTGAQTLGGIYGSHQQSNANKQALAYQERANLQAMDFEREQMTEAKRQFEIQQAMAKQSWDATQAFEAKKWAASEEERLHARQLEDEKEARRAPYRQMSADALARIPGILDRGRATPGLGSLGSYRSNS